MHIDPSQFFVGLASPSSSSSAFFIARRAARFISRRPLLNKVSQTVLERTEGCGCGPNVAYPSTLFSVSNNLILSLPGFSVICSASSLCSYLRMACRILHLEADFRVSGRWCLHLPHDSADKGSGTYLLSSPSMRCKAYLRSTNTTLRLVCSGAGYSDSPYHISDWRPPITSDQNNHAEAVYGDNRSAQEIVRTRLADSIMARLDTSASA